MRSSVDLPQPDGPTKTTNSPFSIVRSMPLMARVFAEEFFDALEFEECHVHLLLWSPEVYLTAPKVSPCTSCFWLNQPNTTIGAIAISEAADSLAQNRPSGLEYEAISVASVPALAAAEVERPERLVPAQHQAQQAGGGQPAHRQRQQHPPELLPQRGAVHARRFQDLVRDVLAGSSTASTP